MNKKKFSKKKIKKIVYTLLILIIAATAIGFVLAYEESMEATMASENLIQGEIFLAHREFSTVFLDEDYIYAGGTSGLYKIHSITHTVEEILNDNQSFEVVRGIDRSEDGILWIGHGHGLTGLKNDVVVKHYDTTNGLPDYRVNDLAISDGTIYVATFGGIGIINEEVKALTEGDGLLKNITKVIMIDQRGDLWCGAHTSVGGGVTLVKERTIGYEMKYFTTENGLSHNAITTIIEDQQGDVWIGNGNLTKGGATRYTLSSNQWIPSDVLTIKEGLIGDKVRHIFIDKQDNLWFCSESEGIAILKTDGNMMYLTSASGLSDNEVKQIIYDQEANLWLASKNGVTKIYSQWLEENIN